MQQTLLSTKLHIPAPCQPLLPRSRLTDMFAQAKTHRITLVCAPPGYGKTTLVSSWLRETSLPYTWLSLDESDNDPTRFLEYFLTALHQLVPAIRPDLLDLVQGSQAASFHTLMTLVINAAAGVGDIVIVLDDFHVLHASPILEMLGYLLEHLPPGVHMVILSRTDPLLPLARLRARGQMLEIRAEQLRFTRDEIAQFFDDVMGLTFCASDISAIETRTEGWIAGLQLAGLAVQKAQVSAGGSKQVEIEHHQFIEAFTGSHVYIMDYLTEEVLRSQPERSRSFLLQTAVLERMCGPLCEAVFENDSSGPLDGQAMLEASERDHLFVIPLDSERRWYRYHHLFREVLCHRLEVLFPGKIPGLHQRASVWFEQHGLIHEAIQHAVRAGNLDRTASLVEQHGCALLMGGELTTLAGWLAAIDPYTHTHAWLAMQKAWVLSLNGQAELAELAIDAGEQILANLELTDEVRTLRGSFTAARAHWAKTQGQTDAAARYARQAIDLLSGSSDFSCALRSVATSLLGDASWVQGKMAEARQAYTDAVQIGQIAGNPHMTMLSNISLADVYFEQGQFHQAARAYLETLHMADRVDGHNSSYAQGGNFGLSRVYYAWNRLDEASTAIEECLRLSRLWGNTNLQAACQVRFAQIAAARGDREMAQAHAAEAEEYRQNTILSPDWSLWVRTALARFWVSEGKIEKAFFLLRDLDVLPDLVSQSAVSPDAPVPYRLEAAYLILARLYLAQDNPDAALNLCARLLLQAKTGERGKVVTELLILQALAYQAKKDIASALEFLERAMSMAWPEQATRLFLDEGEQMAKLIYQAKARGTTMPRVGGDFVDAILAYFGLRSELDRPSAVKPPATQTIQPSALIEPLSARELEVLRAIADGCSNQEMADRFVLSPKTIKRHISNIYAKLGAKNRTQAVALARSLKLID